MFASTHALARRRLAAGLLIVVAAVVAVPLHAAAAVATDPGTISGLERQMVAALNHDRIDAGLVPVRVDSRLMAIARARSVDMATKGYFSHTQPDGRNVFDILSAQHVTWYNAGEIIAWNNYPLDLTVAVANGQWMASAGHHAIIVSTDFNYVGVGLAVDPSTGKKLWTAVFIKGPDRTGARATVRQPAVKAGLTSMSRYASLRWSGNDVRLQVLNAGLRSFTVQRRVDGGSWTTLLAGSTLTGLTVKVYLTHRYEFRVAAIDRKGNRGSWVTTVVDLR